MEIRKSLSQKIIIGALILVIAFLAILIIKKAFEGLDKTPKTAIERQYLDALEVVKKDPQNAKARLKLAMIYVRLGRNNEAMSEIKIAIKLDKNDPEIYYGYGIVAKSLGDYDKAIEAFIRSTKLEGTVADVYREAYYEIGGIYYKQKKYKKAVEYFEKSVKSGPEATYTLIYLAKAYEKAGMKEKAIQEYKEILLYQPDYKPAKEALKRLSDDKSKKSTEKSTEKNKKPGGK